MEKKCAQGLLLSSHACGMLHACRQLASVHAELRLVSHWSRDHDAQCVSSAGKGGPDASMENQCNAYQKYQRPLMTRRPITRYILRCTIPGRLSLCHPLDVCLPVAMGQTEGQGRTQQRGQH